MNVFKETWHRIRNIGDNLLFLHVMRSTYPIPIKSRMFSLGTMGAAFHYNSQTEAPVRIVYSFWLLFSFSLRISILHELGHAYSKHGRDNDPLVAEIAAWEWAFSNSPTGIRPVEIGTALGCYMSYVGTAPVSPKVKFKCMTMFSKIIATRYIGYEE